MAMKTAPESTGSSYPVHEKTLLIRPEFLNHAGTLFGGFMMQWADEMAYNAASLAFPGAFVTKLVREFNFQSPVRNGDIIKIYSHVASVGRTSCVVEVWALNAQQKAEVFRTSAIMVNIQDGKATPIQPGQ